jgi:F0F1-type ATP synthase membrane subunit b/b'
MKRLIFTLVLATTAPLGFAAAQEPAAEAAHEKKGGKEAEGDEGGLEIWKWANFLVLAGGLGYLIGKNAGPFFAARSAGIRKDMEESLRQRQEAEARAAEVERRLAALGADIAALKAEEDRDMKAFTERLAQQTT